MSAARPVFLLIDVSNSFTKIAFADRARLLRKTKLPTSGLTVRALRKVIGERAVSRIILSSVVPRKNGAIKQAAGRIPMLELTATTALGVGIEYPEPATIGADRLANAAAVAELYGTPAIVVDFGTAVTFDVVSAAGKYIGGVIAPGLEAMTGYLYQRTALLPQIDLREPRAAVGKSTRDAMLSGAVFGYRGLVREILAQIRRETFRGRKVHVVATGGYAELIVRHLPMIDVVDENLTLEGLRIVANLNPATSEGAPVS